MLLAGMAAVQHGSTATHPDAGGRAGTREDGDLHGWTRVDVLPPDGMQEVSGSSPLSSTGQKRNSNNSNRQYSSKVQQRRPSGPPYVCSDRASCTGWGCWHGCGFQTLNRRWPTCHLGQYASHRSGDFCRIVTNRLSGRPFLPSTVAAFASDPAALAVPAGPIRSQEPRPLGRAARPLTVGSARRCCQSSAGPLVALRR